MATKPLATFSFTSGRNGWSETHAFQEGASLPSVLDAAMKYAPIRGRLLGEGATLTGVLIRDINNYRQTLERSVAFKGDPARSTGPVKDPFHSLLIELQGTLGGTLLDGAYQTQFYLGGVGALEFPGGTDIFAKDPFFTLNKQFFDRLTNKGWGWRGYDVHPGTSPVRDVVSIVFDGHVATIKTRDGEPHQIQPGDPFRLRGVRLADRSNINGVYDSQITIVNTTTIQVLCTKPAGTVVKKFGRLHRLAKVFIPIRSVALLGFRRRKRAGGAPREVAAVHHRSGS